MKKSIIVLLLLSIGLLFYKGISSLNDLLIILSCIQAFLWVYYMNKIG